MLIAKASTPRPLDTSRQITSTLTLICILCLSFTVPHAKALSSTSIVGYSEITITNDGSVDSPSPLQQRVTLDSQSLAGFGAANLQNIEFLGRDGTQIPSWLESWNTTSSSATWWLRVSETIPAKSSLTVYAEYVAPTTSLFDGSKIGEAPNLSPAYAQYDNGRTIFNFYDNFAGTLLNSEWNNVASDGAFGDRSEVLVNDKLILVPTLGTFYGQGTWVGSTGTPSAQARGPLAADAYIAAAQPVTNFARSACEIGCFETRFGFEDMLPNNLNEGNGLGVDIAQPSVLTISNGQYDQVFVPLPTTTLNQFNVYTVNYATSTASFQLNYGDLAGTITTDVPSPSPRMGLFLETNYQQISGNIGWVRTRTLSSDGVMPTASAGPAQPGSPVVQSPDLPIFSQWWLWMIIGLSIIAVFVLATVIRSPRSKHRPASTSPSLSLNVCPQCGASMPPGSSFCGKCGNKLQLPGINGKKQD